MDHRKSGQASVQRAREGLRDLPRVWRTGPRLWTGGSSRGTGPEAGEGFRRRKRALSFRSVRSRRLLEGNHHPSEILPVRRAWRPTNWPGLTLLCREVGAPRLHPRVGGSLKSPPAFLNQSCSERTGEARPMKLANWFAILVITFLTALAPAMDRPAAHTKGIPVDKPAGELNPGEYWWNPQLSPKGPLMILVSVPKQVMHVYRNGILIGRSSVSTGAKGHATPGGIFTILEKKATHRSKKYN